MIKQFKKNKENQKDNSKHKKCFQEDNKSKTQKIS